MARLENAVMRVAMGLFAFAAGGPFLHGQASTRDYARAERMLGWHADKLVTHTISNLDWIDGERFWYRRQVAAGHEFMFVDPVGDVHRPAFDHTRLAAALSAASGGSYVAEQLPFSEFDYLDDDSIRFWENRKRRKHDPQPAPEAERENRRWTCSLSSYRCSGPDNVAPEREDEIGSPDGRWVAFARGENLWIRSVESGEEAQLSIDGEENYGYAVPSEGCCYTVTARREKTKVRPVLFWSPDSRKIATWQLDERKVEDLHLLETRQGRPLLHSYKYALPGDEAIPRYRLHVFDIESRNRVGLEGEAQEHFWGPGDDIDFRWSADGEKLYYVRQYRGHQKLVLFEGDVNTGAVRQVLEETSETFLDLPGRPDAHRDRTLQDWRLVNDGKEVLWWSERDGWGHFYLFDVRSGELKNQVTAGSWYAQTILHVDEANRRLYFYALGREPGLYPYASQLYRVRLDGSGLERLSRNDAHHEVRVSRSGRFFVDTYSTRSEAPVTVLLTPAGEVLRTLEEADTAALEATGWSAGEPFSSKARDGVTDVYGFIYRPSNFDPRKKYPIIDYIYPGPQIGPVRFRGFTASPGGNARALAELGFVVVHFDSVGTPFRSKAFHDVWYGDMGDNGLIEHVETIKQLAGRHPEIDLDRVGIFGHSGGGFSSTDAILRYPDFFKVAVSGAGNHDNRSYSYGWGEKYQGLMRKSEDGSDNYDSQANHLLAGNLKGKLLLTYGTLDDNVHPNATLLLIEELIRNNKDFDLLVIPNGNHRYASLTTASAAVSGPYVLRRTWDYFVRHLLGRQPPVGYRFQRPE